MGRDKEALASYRSALAAIEKLAESDPGNLQWQRDIAILEGQIGGVLADRGATKDALVSFQRSLAISQKLLGEQSRQRPVAARCVGDPEQDRRRADAGREQGRGAQGVSGEPCDRRERSLPDNPKSAEWQRDLAISLVRVGDAVAATDRAAARDELRAQPCDPRAARGRRSQQSDGAAGRVAHPRPDRQRPRRRGTL